MASAGCMDDKAVVTWMVHTHKVSVIPLTGPDKSATQQYTPELTTLQPCNCGARTLLFCFRIFRGFRVTVVAGKAL